MNPTLVVNIVVGITAVLYFVAAYVTGKFINPWWYGFWGSYGVANFCWLKAMGVL
jgi:hypothetical protein